MGDWSYPFACLVLRAVAATAIFVALAAGALAGQKDARDERPYIYSPDFLAVGVRLLLFGVRRFVDYSYLDWWAVGGEGGWTEEVEFCVDYHYAVTFYRERAYDCVDCVHVGFVALGVEHQAVSPGSSSHSFGGLAGAGLLADYALGVWADAPVYQLFGVCNIAKRCPYIFFEGVLLGESFFDLVGDLGARGAYEHYVVEWGSPEEVGDEEGAGVDVWVVVVYYESACLSALFSVFLEGVDYCVLPFAQAPAYVCLEWAT